MLRAGDTVVIDGSALGTIASISGSTVTLTANATAAVSNKTGLVDFHDGMSYAELLPKALLAAKDFTDALKDALPTGAKKDFYTQLASDLAAEQTAFGSPAPTRTAVAWVAGDAVAALGVAAENGKVMSKFDLSSTRA